MITYVEKGHGLHAKIADAGHSLYQKDGVWAVRPASAESAVQAIIDGYTLAEAKAARKAEVDRHATWLRDRIVEGISPGEMAWWPTKRREAEAYTAEPVDETNAKALGVKLLYREAQRRKTTTKAIRDRVLANADAFETVETAIAGTAGKHKDAIDALTDFVPVATYDYSGGWPL